MEWFAPVEWSDVFTPDTPLLELITRGSVMYLALFCLLRMIRRQAGSLSMSDLLVVVLIADAAQNAMAGGYHSLPDGIVLVATLVFWNFLLDWLGFHSSGFEKIIHPPPLVLIKNGRLVRRNMKKGLITTDDIMNRLREKGVDKISQVKKACLEGDGKISVIKKG